MRHTTNEELVSAVQAGDRSKLSDLWTQNQGIIRKKANGVMSWLEDSGRGGYEFDDLMQCSFLILEKAVSDYSPDKGCSFITFFWNALQWGLPQMVGLGKSGTDALNDAVSLETPIDDTNDICTLADIIESPEDDIGNAINRIVDSELRKTVEEILSGMDGARAAIVRRYLYSGLPRNAAAEALGIPAARFPLHLCELLKAANPRKFRALYNTLKGQYVNTRIDFYLQGSVLQQSSPVEAIVIRREELENRFDAKMKTGGSLLSNIK